MARQTTESALAKQPAGREAGISDDACQQYAVRKTRPHFPGAHGGGAAPEVGGHLFLKEVMSQAPAFQDDGEIGPQAAGWFQAATLTATAGLKKFIHKGERFPHSAVVVKL